MLRARGASQDWPVLVDNSTDPSPSLKPSTAKPPCKSAKERTRPHLATFIFLQLVVYQPLRGYIPGWLLKLLLVPGLVFLGWSLIKFPRWQDEHKHIPRFIACLAALFVELVVEYELVWLISATDRDKYKTVPGLQDNGEIALLWLADRVPGMQGLLFWRWLDTLPFLLAFLTVALSVLWDQVPYSGFGIASRMTLAMALSRVVRCLSFMATLLPNPRPGCYTRKFPPLPDSLWETLAMPFTRRISASGGCNDLIFSGHGAFWVITPLVVQAYYPGHPGLVALLWAGVVQTSARDVVERWHYSVDMVLAVFCTWAVWSWLEWLYPPSAMFPERPPGVPPDPLRKEVLAVVILSVGFGLVIVVGFGG